MLTSSDAKWRCLWHLFVWSLLLTFVSQCLGIPNHIAFYIFACLSIMILPILTAVYSNTSGRRGSGLLRVAYVIMDPVLSCLTITPVKLVKYLPVLLNNRFCHKHNLEPNSTRVCVRNASLNLDPFDNFNHSHTHYLDLQKSDAIDFIILQCSLVLPVLITLGMGRRSHKMEFSTYLACSTYWLMVVLEVVSLLEIALRHEGYKHSISTTSIMIAVVLILANSYGVVTLCSYISPTEQYKEKEKDQKKFDMIYKIFIGLAGIFFVEIPLIVARFQIIFYELSLIQPGSFYFWLLKDFVFLIIIPMLLIGQRFGLSFMKLGCKPAFDTEVFFQPEKRDVYIQRVRRVTFKDPPEDDAESAETNVNHVTEDSTKVATPVSVCVVEETHLIDGGRENVFYTQARTRADTDPSSNGYILSKASSGPLSMNRIVKNGQDPERTSHSCDSLDRVKSDQIKLKSILKPARCDTDTNSNTS